MSTLPKVAIIELGGQLTLKIGTTLREFGVRSVILEPKRAGGWLRTNPVKGIILSGSGASVTEKNAPRPPDEIFSVRTPENREVPLLGICYGMQWLAYHFGGEVMSFAEKREYGLAQIKLIGSGTYQRQHRLFVDLPGEQQVWMSHGDSVSVLPHNWVQLATSDAGAVAAMTNGKMWAVQFHPEASQTKFGKKMLQHFVLDIAGCEADWETHSMTQEIKDRVLEDLGPRRAIFGFSGGVDSTALAAILAPALGDQFMAITIDGGQLRQNELAEIQRHAQVAETELWVVNAQDEFAAALAGVTDAEEKRRKFREVYRAVFMRYAQRIEATAVIQGTLAPDRIESGATGGSLIKTHHNVGLDLGKLIQLHPFDHLFKYEVRALARSIGLPGSVWNRQPFPGPGLFLRIVGVPVSSVWLGLVRSADAQVRSILERHGLYEDLSQLVVAYFGVPTVGVKGDVRVYGGAIVVRAVETIDFMTANGVRFPGEVKDEIEAALTRHPEIVRVWYDETKKPPATTEFE